MRHPASLNLFALLFLLVAMTVSVRAAQRTAPPTSEPLLRPDASGEEIYRQACAACHNMDGSGQPQSVVGFQLPLPNGHAFPDFNDCATNTVEPLADWMAVVHRGGPVRALDRHMPAFGDALTDDQIERAVKYVWTFCKDSSWPRGDLNLPRAFFTEKAFPENETVWTTGVTTSGAKAVSNELVYEHRIGSRSQFEVTLPIAAAQQEPGGTWSRGIGDVEFAVRRTFYANLDRGSIFAAGGAVIARPAKRMRDWAAVSGPTSRLPCGDRSSAPTPSFRCMAASKSLRTRPSDHRNVVRRVVRIHFARARVRGAPGPRWLEVLTGRAQPHGAPPRWDVCLWCRSRSATSLHILLSARAGTQRA
jgi:mono/diheme cytochrome c family protein